MRKKLQHLALLLLSIVATASLSQAQLVTVQGGQDVLFVQNGAAMFVVGDGTAAGSGIQVQTDGNAATTEATILGNVWITTGTGQFTNSGVLMLGPLGKLYVAGNFTNSGTLNFDPASTTFFGFVTQNCPVFGGSPCFTNVNTPTDNGGNTAQIYTFTATGTGDLGNVVMDKNSGQTVTVDATLPTKMQLQAAGSVLQFINGVIVTSIATAGNEVSILNTAANAGGPGDAIIGHDITYGAAVNGNNYVFGQLRRALAAAGPAYDFPVGGPIATRGIQLMRLTFSVNPGGVPNVLGFFDGGTSTAFNDANGRNSTLMANVAGSIPCNGAPFFPQCGAQFDHSLSNGTWKMNSNDNTGVYNARANARAASLFVGAPAACVPIYALLKATDAGGAGAMNNSGNGLGGDCFAGGANPNDVTRNNMGTFSQFMVGRAEVNVLPVDNLHLTATGNQPQP